MTDALAEGAQPSLFAVCQDLVIVELQAKTAVHPVSFIVLKVLRILRHFCLLLIGFQLRLDEDIDRLRVVHLHVVSLHSFHDYKRRNRVANGRRIVRALREDHFRFPLLSLMAKAKVLLAVLLYFLRNRVNAAPDFGLGLRLFI